MRLENICCFFRKKPTKTFSYFIPAPPLRKSGYQEREFDQLIEYLQEKGFRLLRYKLASVSSEKVAGVWIICELQARTKEARDFKIDLDYQSLANALPENIEWDQPDEGVRCE